MLRGAGTVRHTPRAACPTCATQVLVCEWIDIPSLDLWDVVIEVLHSSNNVPPTQKISALNNKPKIATGSGVRDNVHNIRLRKEGDQNVDQLSNLDYVTTNAHYSPGKAQLSIFEDSEALIKMSTEEVQ